MRPVRVDPLEAKAEPDLWWVPLFFLMISLGLGCASARGPIYDWQSYETSLQASQIAQNQPQAAAALEESVRALQASGNRAPPGLYAEYGLLLYTRGDSSGAIEYFRKEAQSFPEAKPLMERLISRAEQKSSTTVASKSQDTK